jgi:hypothetical protein
MLRLKARANHPDHLKILSCRRQALQNPNLLSCYLKPFRTQGPLVQLGRCGKPCAVEMPIGNVPHGT